MKSFGKGFVFGTIATISAVAGCVYAFKKTVERPKYRSLFSFVRRNFRSLLFAFPCRIAALENIHFFKALFFEL